MSPRTLDADAFGQRENDILECALNFISQEGIAALTMDKLVKALPYSKGTVYNHFSGKEDLLLALCNRGMKILAEMFDRAATYDGIPRERALCMFFAYMLYAKLSPTQFMLVLTAKTDSVTKKASVTRQNEHLELEGRLIKPAVEIFANAQKQGELNPPIPLTLQQITFICWSQSFGTNALLNADTDRCSARQGMLIEEETMNGMHILLDGLNFFPRSDQHDWSALIKRIKTDIFQTEIQQLAQMGVVLAI